MSPRIPPESQRLATPHPEARGTVTCPGSGTRPGVDRGARAAKLGKATCRHCSRVIGVHRDGTLYRHRARGG